MTPASGAKPALLIVDDDPLIVATLGYYLENSFQVVTAASRSEAIETIKRLLAPPDLALVDLGLPPIPHRPEEGFSLIAELLACAPQIRIVVLSGQNDSANARHARTLGALEFVAKPVAPDRLRELLMKLLDLRAAAPEDADRAMLGDSPAIQKLRLQLRQYADSPFPVLIEGESGSGKELAAIALHKLSQRGDKPYLTLNCAAIAPTLVEAALFGHAKGAFTGAAVARGGFFEEAAGGTLVLDEVGELPLDLQPKLLRVLENGEYQRVGETQTRRSQARVIAATNRDIKSEVRAGRFRTDLYHRLSVFTITVPPLRERGNDRFRLLDHFKREFADQFRQAPFSLAPAAEKLWREYGFPGNVRELRNIAIRLAARFPGQSIDAVTLAEEFDPQQDASPPAEREAMIASARRSLAEQSGSFNLDATLMRWEDAYIEAARRMANGNISQAARLLGINRTTLYNRIETLARDMPHATPPAQ